MSTPKRISLIHGLTFLVVLGLLVSATLLYASLAPGYHDASFNFNTMNENQVLDLTGLDRKQTGSLKFGSLKYAKPPAIGVFGNHQFMHFGIEAFEGQIERQDFFNFWYANLGLPEVLHALSYLAELDKLPKLVLVQITTPNNDMGRHLIDWGGELPDAFVDTSLLKKEGYFTYLDWLVRYYLKGKIQTIFNINKLRAIWVNRNAPQPQEDLARRIVDTGDTPPPPRSFRPDGSLSPEGRTKKLIKNGDSMQRGQVIFWGDEKKIAKYMRTINELCESQGSKVVFIVPPVYEDKRDTEVDRIFNEALEMTPEINLIDHRDMRGRKDFFVIFDHPDTPYYIYMVKDLVSKGYLPENEMLEAGSD